MELAVLKSNDWEKYRPNFIIMESGVNDRASLDAIYQDPAVSFLLENKYIVVAKAGIAVFLKDTTTLLADNRDKRFFSNNVAYGK